MASDHKTNLKVLNAFLEKSDGRDKLLATVQYAAMFISAGAPGDVKKVQASVAAARKVFRLMRPLEALTPLLLNPALSPAKPLPIEVLNKLKPALMSLYFAADHVGWASQAGLVSNKDFVARAQKVSTWGWFGGSLCTVVSEVYELSELTVRRAGESEEEFLARLDKSRGEANRRLLVLVHAVFQALLAMGLLELRPWKPRTVGLLGIIASAMNCYMLTPARPAAAVQPPPRLAVKTS